MLETNGVSANVHSATSGGTNAAIRRSVICLNGRMSASPKNQTNLLKLFLGELPKLKFKLFWRVHALLHHERVHCIHSRTKAVVPGQLLHGLFKTDQLLFRGNILA